MRCSSSSGESSHLEACRDRERDTVVGRRAASRATACRGDTAEPTARARKSKARPLVFALFGETIDRHTPFAPSLQSCAIHASTPAPGLVSRIADCCTLHDYVSCRAGCSAWRAAIQPLTSRPLVPVQSARMWAGSPCQRLLQRRAASAGPGFPVSPNHRGFAAPPTAAVSSARATGGSPSSPPPQPTAAGRAGLRRVVSLLNALTGTEIPLHATLYDRKCEQQAKNVVFSPDLTPRDFAAVSMCRPNRLAIHRSIDGHSSHLTSPWTPTRSWMAPILSTSPTAKMTRCTV
ncbi:hypothetical protein GUJ93_ZPchr0014g47306 [Zizania palustris]|uniref:Uncharacterized protein n=1 Tax=Zizania palustris TaxID=103762 RepID=A0A8J5W6T7_ZIZPA|nr:hypothetical protein GUJ93_ZPchr0014g47306 [Zizania palustris]